MIVADESVSALDVSIKAQVVNLLLDLQQQLGLSYLFISHDMAVVERISHQVAVMYLGEIVEIGPAAAVFKQPAAPLHQAADRRRPGPRPGPAQRSSARSPTTRSRARSAPVDYVPPKRSYRTVSEGHLVQEWDGDWKM